MGSYKTKRYLVLVAAPDEGTADTTCNNVRTIEAMMIWRATVSSNIEFSFM
jgi:hypothetical protein